MYRIDSDAKLNLLPKSSCDNIDTLYDDRDSSVCGFLVHDIESQEDMLHLVIDSQEKIC